MLEKSLEDFNLNFHRPGNPSSPKPLNDKLKAKGQKENGHSHKHGYEFTLNLTESEESLFAKKEKHVRDSPNGNYENNVLRQKLQSTQDQLKKVAGDKKLIIEELSGLRNNLRGFHSRGNSASKDRHDGSENAHKPEKKIKTAKTSPATKQYSKKLFAEAKETLMSRGKHHRREVSAGSQDSPKKNNYFATTEKYTKRHSAGEEVINTHKSSVQERETQNAKATTPTYDLLQADNRENRENNQELLDLKKRFKELEDEKVFLVDSLGARVNQMKEANSKLESENQSLNEKLLAHNQQMNELKMNYDKAVFEIQQLTAKLENANLQSNLGLEKEKLENMQLLSQCEENQILLASTKLLLKQKEDFIEKLQEEIKSLQSSFEEEKNFLLENEKNLKNKVLSLQKAHHETLLKCQMLEDSIKDTVSENTLEKEKAKTDLEKAQNKLSELRKKLEELEVTHSAVEQENVHLKARLDLLVKENGQLQLTSKEKDNFITDLQMNLQGIQSEKDKIQGALSSLQRERDLLIEENARVRKEMQDYKTEKTKYNTTEEESSRKIAQLAFEKSQLEETCREQQSEIERQQQLILKIEVQLSEEITNRANAEKKYLEKIQEMRNEVQDLKHEKDKVVYSEDDLAVAKKQIETSLVAEYLKQKEAFMTQIDSLKEEHLKLKEKIIEEENKSSTHREEAEKQIEKLKIELEENLTLLEQQQGLNQRTNEALSHATQRLQELEKQVESENMQKQEAQNLVAELKAQNAKIKQEHQQLTDLYNKTETSKSPLVSEIQELTKSNNELRLEIQEKQNRNITLENENRELRITNEEKALEAHGLKGKLESYELQAKRFFVENSELKSKLQDYQKQKEIDQALLSKSNAFIDENSRLKQELVQVREEVARLKEELAKSNVESARVIEETTQTFESQNLLLTTENEKLKEDITRLSSEFESLKVKNQELNAMKNVLEDESNQIKSELETKIQEYQHLLSTKVSDILLTGNNMREYALKAKQMIEQLQNLTNNHNSNQHLIEELKSKGDEPSSPTSSISSAKAGKANVRSEEEEDLSDVEEQESKDKNGLKEPDSAGLHSHDVGKRILSLETKLKQAREEAEVFKQESESKDSTIEFLKDSMKARMVKHQEQMTELKNECERVKAEFQQRCRATEDSLRDQLMLIIQDVARYKKFGLSKKDIEDVRNIFIEVRKLLIQTLEENAALSAKKNVNPVHATDTAVEQLRKEVANAYYELEKARNNVSRLEETTKKLVEEKQQNQKAIIQANRIKAYLSPIKEEELIQIISKDQFIKPLASNIIFIKDAMIYHHFLSEILSSESPISIPTGERTASIASIASIKELEETKEEARVLKQKLAMKDEEKAAQAKVWSSVVTKLDQKLRSLIKMAKLEEVYEAEVQKHAPESKRSDQGAANVSSDRLFADRMAIKINILQDVVKSMLALREQNAK